MIVEQSFFIGVQDLGPDQAMSEKCLMECLSNTAVKHATLAGQGIDDRPVTHVSWVVTGWRIHIFSRPRCCDTLRVTSWIHDGGRITSIRDFEVFDGKGDLVARASSQWMPINLANGFLKRITPQLMAPYQAEPDHRAFDEDLFLDPRSIDLTPESFDIFTISGSMIDCNGHVHNTAYLDMAREVLPSEVQKTTFNRVEACYKKEIPARATVKLEYAKQNETHYVFIRDITDNSLHAVILFAE